MKARIRRPEFLLVIIALLTGVLVQSGELGSVDTVRRLQVTHWIWTSAPQVAQGDFPGFGIPGRDGKIYAWYGIGQSLLMLPLDMAATGLMHAVPALHARPEVRTLLITYTLSPLICALAILAAFRLLQDLGFSIRESAAGALGLLFATTFLHYTQNMMENNLLLLLLLTGFRLQYEWLQGAADRKLVAGSIVLGSAMLVRLTVALDILTVAAIIILLQWRFCSQWKPLVRAVYRYAQLCAPAYLSFVLLDRAYHYYRFAQCCTNYIQLYGEEQKRLDPTLPANFPNTVPFWKGFLGPFLTPEKSVFLFDPLLIILVVVVFLCWKRLAQHIKVYVSCMAVLLVVYSAFHARLWFWSGDVAWGDRYLTSPVQMLALLAIPLLLRHGADLGKPFRALAWAIVGMSVLIQTESILLPPWVEFKQLRALGHPAFPIWLRLRNVIDLFSQRAPLKDATGIYLYPFTILREAQHVPHWASAAVVAVWLLLAVALCVALRRLRVVLSKFRPTDHAEGSAAHLARQGVVPASLASQDLSQARAAR